MSIIKINLPNLKNQIIIKIVNEILDVCGNL